LHKIEIILFRTLAKNTSKRQTYRDDGGKNADKHFLDRKTVQKRWTVAKPSNRIAQTRDRGWISADENR